MNTDLPWSPTPLLGNRAVARKSVRSLRAAPRFRGAAGPRRLAAPRPSIPERIGQSVPVASCEPRRYQSYQWYQSAGSQPGAFRHPYIPA
jgi:hypothetical protein